MFYDEHERICPTCGQVFSGPGVLHGLPTPTWLLLEHMASETPQSFSEKELTRSP